MSPNAIKNAAIISMMVSVGPVSVLVIAGVIGATFTGGVTPGAERTYATHSLWTFAAPSFPTLSMICATIGYFIIPTSSPFLRSVLSRVYPAPSSASINLIFCPAGRIYWSFVEPDCVGVQMMSLLFFHSLVSSLGVDDHFVVPNVIIFGSFCSLWYAIMSEVVLLVQLSNNPVSFFLTATEPPSKHWSQLLLPNAEFDAQLIDLFSASEVVCVLFTGTTAVAAAGIVTAAFIVVVPTVGLIAASPDAANASGVASVTTMRRERIFCIYGIIIRMYKTCQKPLYNSLCKSQKKYCLNRFFDYNICTFIL